METTTTKEYVLWGVPEGELDECVLYTKATTMPKATQAKAILESKGCTKVRIQVLDMSVDDLAERFGG